MKVLISTGGSGGHIFPALQLGLEMQKRGHTIVFAGALAMSLDKIRSLGFEAILIDAQGLTDKSPGGLLRFGSTMLRAMTQAFKVIDNVRPDKVVGFGGYGSFPVLMTACLKRYPTMLHEQNVIPGKANKILGQCVAKVAVSFKQTMPLFGAKAIWTGCPCNNEAVGRNKEAIKASFSLRLNTTVVVLLGGSQGSKVLNETFFKTMQELGKDGLIEAVHVTGKAEYLLYKEKYATAHLPVIVRDFISPIGDAYAVADIIISRSGAATVSELGSFGIPSILVPYPFAHGHQVHNARVLVQAGSAVLIEQKNLSVNALAGAIRTYIGQHISREKLLRQNSSFFIEDAAARLADALEIL